MSKYFLIYLLSFLVVKSSFAQSDTSKVNPYKLALVLGSGASVLGGSYIYVQNSWWSEKQIPFHFDNGADLTYALNVDKVGHFMGGLEAADIFYSSIFYKFV